MFVDEIKLKVTAGTGGDGIVAYRREFKVEKGGPFGGNGGAGGDVIFIGDEGLNTLLTLKYKKVLKADNGERGRNKGQYGKNAKPTYVPVPLGTIVYNALTNELIGEILKNKEELIVAKGGRGGRGNMSFASGALKCPDFAEKGEPGVSLEVKLELKVLADAGLVGFPSVGKSTLIAAISNARPKIAPYHFTTLNPHLGLVAVDADHSFVLADLPGLIEGAHLNVGLGFKFLRHIERCKVIVHVIDMAAVDGRDPYTDYLAIKKELSLYKEELQNKPEIILANKMDMPSASDNLLAFKEKVTDIAIFPISALNKTNLTDLIFKLYELIKTYEAKTEVKEVKKTIVYELEQEKPDFVIKQENDVYFVTGEKIERLFKMTDFNNNTSVTRFARQLRAIGVDQKLIDLGIKEGDVVDILGYSFEYVE